MSGGFSSGFRPSANVVSVGPDPIRRNWLETTTYAPDSYRAQNGLSQGLTQATRNLAAAALFNERPTDVDPTRDYLDVGRGGRVSSYPDGISPLAPLGQYSPPPTGFRSQVADALLSQQVGNALTGQPTRSDNPAGDALAFLFGGYSGGGR